MQTFDPAFKSVALPARPKACCLNDFLLPTHYPTRDLLRRLGLLKAGSHNLHYHINNLNTEKIPAQWWLERQVTCSLGMCHGSHTLYTCTFSTLVQWTDGSAGLQKEILCIIAKGTAFISNKSHFNRCWHYWDINFIKSANRGMDRQMMAFQLYIR